MLYVLLVTSTISFLGEVLFLSGLMAGPTYQPLVQHSNPDAPLIHCTDHKQVAKKLFKKKNILLQSFTPHADVFHQISIQ